MPIVLEKLKDETRPLTASYLGAEVSFTYRHNLLTIARDEELRAKQSAIKPKPKKKDEEKDEEAEALEKSIAAEQWIIDYVKEFVASWDVLLEADDVKAAPIDDDVLKLLPAGLLGAMVEAIQADQRPTPTKRPNS